MLRKECGVGVRRSRVPAPHGVATARRVPAVSAPLHLKSDGKAFHPDLSGAHSGIMTRKELCELNCVRVLGLKC